MVRRADAENDRLTWAQLKGWERVHQNFHAEIRAKARHLIVLQHKAPCRRLQRSLEMDLERMSASTNSQVYTESTDARGTRVLPASWTRY